MKLSFGTIVPKESYAIADDSDTGTMTSDSNAFGFYKGELIKTELDGFRAEYKINKVSLGVTLYEADALNADTYAMVKGSTAETTDSNGDTSDTYTASSSSAPSSQVFTPRSARSTSLRSAFSAASDSSRTWATINSSRLVCNSALTLPSMASAVLAASSAARDCASEAAAFDSADCVSS